MEGGLGGSKVGQRVPKYHLEKNQSVIKRWRMWPVQIPHKTMEKSLSVGECMPGDGACCRDLGFQKKDGGSWC